MMEKFTRAFQNVYIEEIKQYKHFISSGVYENYYKQVHEEICSMEHNFYTQSTSMSDFEFDCGEQELVFDASIKQLLCYRFLSSLYIGLYSIWELQCMNLMARKLDSCSERIKEFANVVNTLKHGNNPLKDRVWSYQKLKDSNSKYLKRSIKFEKIIPYLHGGEILNISIEDLLSLCDEIIDIWERDELS